MKYLEMTLKAFWGSVIIVVVVYCILTSIHADADTVVPTPTPAPVPSSVEPEPTPAPTPNPVPTPMPEPTPELVLDETDLIMLAKVTYGEARGCTTTEQAAVIWCILNRVEDDQFPDTIQAVITQKGQFIGYDPDHPVWPELVELARDVLTRWKTDGTGRVLPKEYVFFHGDGRHNHFRITFKRTGDYWDWSLPSPYEEE